MDVLSTLKIETAPIHNAVEQVNLAAFIIDSTITLQQYKTHLLSQYNAYKTIEMGLSSFFKTTPHSVLQSFNNTAKSKALEVDLKQLNIPILSPNTVFEVNTEAEAVGALYVIEGSMMGNMLISRKIIACQQLATISEFNFYNADTKAILKRWKTFQELVSTLPLTAEAILQAVTSAKLAFSTFS